MSLTDHIVTLCRRLLAKVKPEDFGTMSVVFSLPAYALLALSATETLPFWSAVVYGILWTAIVLVYFIAHLIARSSYVTAKEQELT